MNSKSIGLIVSAVIGALVLITGISLIAGYNSLVKLEESINLKMATVDSRLQERKDKIDQLVDVVEGYTTVEQSIYTMITNARTAYAAAKLSGNPDDMAEAEALEVQAVNALLAIAEDNPEIKSSQVYISLMIEISSMESALSTARLRYNESVASYNSSARQFPRVIFVNLFNFETTKTYWKIDDGATEVPDINFGE
ncbi:LemA family protein [Acholeplasma vituli]|uniref:LemA family protein n=1 Tax=Paracholeplasma vituli TaxID=69473 RepID=A0ABT2PX85_9MOLU|nr:LemA family protein [Paracholeplasma vituli]MCU0105568.1 LemA family protein [Paracholeplasma vituli]